LRTRAHPSHKEEPDAEDQAEGKDVGQQDPGDRVVELRLDLDLVLPQFGHQLLVRHGELIGREVDDTVALPVAALDDRSRDGYVDDFAVGNQVTELAVGDVVGFLREGLEDPQTRDQQSHVDRDEPPPGTWPRAGTGSLGTALHVGASIASPPPKIGLDVLIETSA
jgi:hypothetical protein